MPSSSPYALVLALLVAAAAGPEGAGAEAGSAGGAAGSARGALPEGARVLRDLAYGADAQQRLDAYLPPAAATADAAAPIVLMVHGGGWTRGDKAMQRVVSRKVDRWLPMGTIVASMNYRMDEREPEPLQQADDVARALAYVQREAPGWGGDPRRVLLMGHSAGAHLVALVAADPRIAERGGAAAWLGTVGLDSAAYDVVEIMSRWHLRLYDRAFGDDAAGWREASPLHRLAGAPAPLLLVCSTRRADACPQAETFAAAARSLGGMAEVLREDLSHGEINADLGNANGYTEAVEAFMRRAGALR